MEYKNFIKDFAARTKSNLELIRANVDRVDPQGYEVTELVNAFLGLLILLDELPDDEFPNKSLTEIGVTHLLGIPQNNADPIKDFSDYVHHLRNAFAHGNIQFDAPKSIIKSIYLQNYFFRTDRLSWTCELTIEDVEFLFNLFHRTIMELP